MPSETSKLKLLYLCQMFYEQTDDQHGVSMQEILDYLQVCGVEAERKAIYRDIDRLREFGLDIQKQGKGGVTYRLRKREFSLGELILLVDAVQSCRFLTKSKSEALVRSIKTLGSKEQVKSLNKRLLVQGRIQMQNESVFSNVDIIQEAIQSKRKVEFRYFKYGVDKQPVMQHGGDVYRETPVQLVFSDGFYYLIAYNDKHESFPTYRVDRMVEICVSDDRATRNEKIANFDPAAYESLVFGMYAGEAVSVTLVVDEEIMGSVIDRFGKDVESTALPAAEGEDAPRQAKVHVRVMSSPVFFGWLAQFAGKVRIESPKALRADYLAFLRGIVDECEDAGKGESEDEGAGSDTGGVGAE